MNQKTAGAKRRRTQTSVAESEGGKESRSDRRERGLISLGRVGVELWRATIDIPLNPFQNSF